MRNEPIQQTIPVCIKEEQKENKHRATSLISMCVYLHISIAELDAVSAAVVGVLQVQFADHTNFTAIFGLHVGNCQDKR